MSEDPRLDLYAADLRACRRYFEDGLRQCDHYERNTANGQKDRIRFAFIELAGYRAHLRAQRAYNRLKRQRGWT